MLANCGRSLSTAEPSLHLHQPFEGHHANQMFSESSSKRLCLRTVFEVSRSESEEPSPGDLIAGVRRTHCVLFQANHPCRAALSGQNAGTRCSVAAASQPFLRAGTMQHHRSANGSSPKVLSQRAALGRWPVSPQSLVPFASAPRHAPRDQPEPLHLHSLDLSDGAHAEAAKFRIEHHQAPFVGRATAAASARSRSAAQPVPEACDQWRLARRRSSGSLQFEGAWLGPAPAGPAWEGRWGATGDAWLYPGSNAG
mmetsp:Transcript_27210/g.65517  ORF Transcript_27210/g.65517 Transcript_27210/m.65517 type:complete len:254 (-) Transcript_27210:13-774(-)